MMLLDELIRAVSQVFAFTLIPFLVYVIRYRSVKGFADYIGLKKSTKKANGLAVLLMVMLAAPLLFLAFTQDAFQAVLTDPATVTGKIHQIGGINALVVIFLVAVIKTSLAEEIFFRGFLAKRLIALTNFQAGNVIQAVIFGILHSLLFLKITQNPVFLVLIFLFPTVGAYLKVYLNEKLAGGSILPGWIAHGLANVVSYSSIAFFV